MENEITVFGMGVLVEMIDAVGIEQGSPALDAMHDVTLVQQKLGQVGAVLAGNPGD
jgi:hypothetical protein